MECGRGRLSVSGCCKMALTVLVLYQDLLQIGGSVLAAKPEKDIYNFVGTLSCVSLHRTSLHITTHHSTTHHYTTHHHTSLHHTSLQHTSPHITTPHITPPHITTHHYTTHHYTTHHHTSLHHTSLHHTSPHITTPHITPPHISTHHHTTTHHYTTHHSTSPHTPSTTAPCVCLQSGCQGDGEVECPLSIENTMWGSTVLASGEPTSGDVLSVQYVVTRK